MRPLPPAQAGPRLYHSQARPVPDALTQLAPTASARTEIHNSTFFARKSFHLTVPHPTTYPLFHNPARAQKRLFLHLWEAHRAPRSSIFLPPLYAFVPQCLCAGPPRASLSKKAKTA
jgi:hypothetical protein